MQTNRYKMPLEKEWLTRAELGRYLPVGNNAIDRQRQSWGYAYERGKGASLRIHGPSWIKRYYEERHAELRKEAADAANDRPLSALDFEDRWKKARAEKTELELAEKRGEVIAIDNLHDDLNEFCTHIREGIEAIEPQAQDIMLSKLAEAELAFGLRTNLNGSSTGKSKSKRSKTGSADSR